MITLRHVTLALATSAALFVPAVRAQRAPTGPRPLPSPDNVPTLVVLFTVDQLRPDYFTRFGPQLTGGLGRLSRGAFFLNGYQDHATTETAPGHASTLSGRFPRSTGIVRNNAGVFDPQRTLIAGARGAGASPFRFRGGTLTDWLRIKDPRTRALSVSGKDRGAILPVGRDNQHVYWYAPVQGIFTTSTYYRDTLPSWVRAFNELRLPWELSRDPWWPLLHPSEYAEPDSVAWEAGPARTIAFPHTATADSAQQFMQSPYHDELVLRFALHGARELGLGAGPQTDLLAVSLSATDYIGHAWGPDSKEIHDAVVRLDRVLGLFLDSLFTRVDSNKVVIALTADHGVAPYPEAQAARVRASAVAGSPLPPDATPTFVDFGPLLTQFAESLQARGVDPSAFTFDGGIVLVNRAALARAKVGADSLLFAFSRAARRVPGVLRVDRMRDLARADTINDDIARRWLHSIPADLPVELVVTIAPFANWFSSFRFAEHGSPHAYDAKVPMILYGRGIRPGRYTRFARVVDLAPTLAWLTATVPGERLDGRILWEALR